MLPGKERSISHYKRVAPLASFYLSRQVALELKAWIEEGQFTLTEPVAHIPMERAFLPQDLWGSQVRID